MKEEIKWRKMLSIFWWLLEMIKLDLCFLLLFDRNISLLSTGKATKPGWMILGMSQRLNHSCWILFSALNFKYYLKSHSLFEISSLDKKDEYWNRGRTSFLVHDRLFIHSCCCSLHISIFRARFRPTNTEKRNSCKGS